MKIPFSLLLIFTICCQSKVQQSSPVLDAVPPPVQTGAERMEQYLPLLRGKNVALVVNQTSIVGKSHLVDTLLKSGISIQKLFSPEHGFRGEAGAGEKVANSKDSQTGLPIVSLYGKHFQPTTEDLNGVEIVVFDIQDVGARFYTYISTLHYIMESCAESEIPLLVLDRPNPNGHYVDGPVLKPDYQSFVGMHSVPVVYGMTIGEYAKMVNDEGWLKSGKKCALTVIPCNNYTHATTYQLPVPPSPNLKTMRAIYLYPSLCFFEGTVVSEGRGTEAPFERFGHPNLPKGDFSFVPSPNSAAKSPKLEGQPCYGTDFSQLPEDSIRAWKSIKIEYLVAAYQALKATGKPFFLETNFIDKLAGTDELRKQVLAGKSADEIKSSWKNELDDFKKRRKKYLLYPDVE